MGLIPRLQQAGYRLEEIRLVDVHGRRIGAISGKQFGSALAGRFFSILRGDLAKAIYAQIDGKSEMIFGDSVTEIAMEADEVQVAFESASPRSFDLVIGADGLHSAVREAVFGPEARFEKYLGYYTASFTAAGYPHRDDNAYISHTMPGRQVARYALRDGRTGFFFVFVQDHRLAIDHRDVKLQKAILDATFGDAGWECPAILEALEGADDLYFDAVSQIRMDEWWRGRVALIGDAAFSPSLLAGQGAAFAMASGYLLAGELERAEGDYRVAFANYQNAFKPFVTAKQHAAMRLGGWFAPKTRLGLLLRNKLTHVRALPLVSDLMTGRMIADRFELPEYPAH
jgi:2-polyprenyl-6-methoxyphenol hydroxylase-like FAD-dependent oxidoreductase